MALCLVAVSFAVVIGLQRGGSEQVSAGSAATELDQARDAVTNRCDSPSAVDGISEFMNNERTRISEFRASVRPELPPIESPSLSASECSNPTSRQIELVGSFNAALFEVIRTDEGSKALAVIDECIVSAVERQFGKGAPTTPVDVLRDAVSIPGDDENAEVALAAIEGQARELQAIGAQCAVGPMGDLEAIAAAQLVKQAG